MYRSIENTVYIDVPKYHVWNRENQKFTLRAKFRVTDTTQMEYDLRAPESLIGDIYTVCPRDAETYLLRLLFLNESNVASYEELQTFDEILHCSKRAVCMSSDLL